MLALADPSPREETEEWGWTFIAASPHLLMKYITPPPGLECSCRVGWGMEEVGVLIRLPYRKEALLVGRQAL